MSINFTTESAHTTREIPKYSLILPVFNNQSGLDWILEVNFNMLKENNCEIIIIDDFSDIEVVVPEGLDNVLLLRNDKNMGVAHSRNLGIEKARAPYIVFLDSDDYLVLDFFEKLSSCIIEEDWDAISFASINIHEKSQRVYVSSYGINFVKSWHFLFKNFFILSGSVVKKKSISEFVFQTRKHEDLYFWYELSIKKRLRVIQDVGTIRSVGNKTSISGNKFSSGKWHLKFIQGQICSIFVPFIFFGYCVMQIYYLVKSRLLRISL